jgi:hypothetical protein
MLRAGKALVLTGYDVITHPDFLQHARSEFEQYLSQSAS